MIHIINNGITWEHPNVNIIYNPVSTYKGRVGQDIFNDLLRLKYRKVYDEYLDYMVGESSKRLLGDIQLVQIDKCKIIMNAFIYKGKELNMLALSKTLVELYNLAHEYELNVSIPMKMNSNNPITHELIKNVINTIFSDFEYDAYIYLKSPYRI